jgi:hypothetical protein
MALSLRWRRRNRIDPIPRRQFEMAMRGGADPITPLSDDYLVEGDEQSNQPSAMLQVVQFTQILLIAVMAVLSLAVFWMIAVMLNIL